MWAEEIDALAPEQKNAVRFEDGEMCTCDLLCDILHAEGAEVLARYADNFYAGSPAVTKNDFGAGHVYYVGTQLEAKALARVLGRAASEAGVKPLIEGETKLEIACREKDGARYFFIMNFAGEPLPLPERFTGKADLLTGKALTAGTVLAPYDALLVQE